MPKDVTAIISYGEIPGANCMLHGGPGERFGTLVDPNGHKWLICAECINSLWEEKQPEPEDESTLLTDEQIRGIVGRMQRMGLIHGE